MPIGAWVLHAACRQIKAWQESGLAPVKVAINLSAVQFGEQGLPELVQSCLTDTGLDPKYLELEITESVIMDDVASTPEILNRLSALGVSLSIDDFGTGYSSLGYLSRTRFSSIYPGVLFTVVSWIALTAAFSFYLGHFAAYASYYGGLAGIIAALYFLYLAALVLIFGGELNRAIRIRRLSRVMRKPEQEPIPLDASERSGPSCGP